MATDTWGDEVLWSRRSAIILNICGEGIFTWPLSLVSIDESNSFPAESGGLSKWDKHTPLIPLVLLSPPAMFSPFYSSKPTRFHIHHEATFAYSSSHSHLISTANQLPEKHISTLATCFHLLFFFIALSYSFFKAHFAYLGMC